ncbi:MAG: hypothetical protein HPY82_18430 [Gammaproteobacteria bacterium]|nr:hypothetical protein [Gammaproteobacteria bacterium]
MNYPVPPEVLRALTGRAFHEARIQALRALRSEALSDGRQDDDFVIRIDAVLNHGPFSFQKFRQNNGHGVE